MGTKVKGKQAKGEKGQGRRERREKKGETPANTKLLHVRSVLGRLRLVIQLLPWREREKPGFSQLLDPDILASPSWDVLSDILASSSWDDALSGCGGWDPSHPSTSSTFVPRTSSEKKLCFQGRLAHSFSSCSCRRFSRSHSLCSSITISP